MSAIPLKDWLASLIEASADSATNVLGFEQKVLPGVGDGMSACQPSVTSGAFISMLSEGGAIELGFAATKDVLQALAKIVLGMAPEEDIVAADTADAIGEVVNIIAGGVKRRLNEAAGGINLGLPLFIEGTLVGRESQEMAHANVLLGEMPVCLIVVRGKA